MWRRPVRISQLCGGSCEEGQAGEGAESAVCRSAWCLPTKRYEHKAFWVSEHNVVWYWTSLWLVRGRNSTLRQTHLFNSRYVPLLDILVRHWAVMFFWKHRMMLVCHWTNFFFSSICLLGSETYNWSVIEKTYQSINQVVLVFNFTVALWHCCLTARRP